MDVVVTQRRHARQLKQHMLGYVGRGEGGGGILITTLKKCKERAAGAGGRFSKVPVTYRARKVSLVLNVFQRKSPFLALNAKF